MTVAWQPPAGHGIGCGQRGPAIEGYLLELDDGCGGEFRVSPSTISFVLRITPTPSFLLRLFEVCCSPSFLVSGALPVSAKFQLRRRQTIPAWDTAIDPIWCRGFLLETVYCSLYLASSLTSFIGHFISKDFTGDEKSLSRTTVVIRLAKTSSLIFCRSIQRCLRHTNVFLINRFSLKVTILSRTRSFLIVNEKGSLVRALGNVTISQVAYTVIIVFNKGRGTSVCPRASLVEAFNVFTLVHVMEEARDTERKRTARDTRIGKFKGTLVFAPRAQINIARSFHACVTRDLRNIRHEIYTKR